MRKESRPITYGMLGVLLVVVVGLFVQGCLDEAGITVDNASNLPAYGLVTPDQASQILDAYGNSDDFVLLDIRTPAEVSDAHIAGAINIDFYSSSFERDLGALDEEKEYLIYCRSGNRSGQSMQVFDKLGFSKVFDLDGGINEWQQLGFPVCEGALIADHVCEWPAAGG